jgi:hypothetical protein
MIIPIPTLIQCVVMLMLGQTMQIFVVKIPALQDRADKANYKFTMKEWWSYDWTNVVITTIIGAVCVIGLDELTQWTPSVLKVVKWFFFFVGAFGTSLALSRWSAFEKKLGHIIDLKTNISDGLVNASDVERVAKHLASQENFES